MLLVRTVTERTRLYPFLRREMGLSSSLIKRLKWQNAFCVNGKPVHVDYMAEPGDTVTADITEQTEGFPPEQAELSVLYEDEWFLAVDKPSGMLTHPSPQKNEGTLANAVLGYFLQSGEGAGVHPVTRLDRDTFGVVIFAKSAHIHAKFCSLLRSGQLEKTYHAAVYGGPAEDAGVIDLPVYKIGSGNLIRTVDPRGQKAVTEYRVLKRLADTSLLELHPLTGRTHQLRLHCSASGFPILGDPQYGSSEDLAFSAREGIFTQQLCAVRLRFPHPVTGETVLLESRLQVRLPD